jgi:hypothetical protein
VFDGRIAEDFKVHGHLGARRSAARAAGALRDMLQDVVTRHGRKIALPPAAPDTHTPALAAAPPARCPTRDIQQTFAVALHLPGWDRPRAPRVAPGYPPPSPGEIDRAHGGAPCFDTAPPLSIALHDGPDDALRIVT